MGAQARAAVSQDRIPSGVFTRDDVRADTAIDADVVIVGSGAGGATLAAELAEANLDVVVLEEGRYFSTRDFTADSSAMVRALYRDGGGSMAIGTPPIMFQEGIAVGGSTVINGGMSWRTPERILERWHREEGIPAIQMKEMEPYFERVERRIHVRTQDKESIGHDHEIIEAGARKMGWKIIPNLRNQVHCPGSNNCAFGCPTGAKQSALVSYVPRALHFGARVYSDVRVQKIVFRGKRAVGVEGHVVREDRGRGPKLTVRARLVVSACGAIQTPALLHRSGFRSPSGRLGRDLSLHPNAKVVAIFDERVRGWQGVHQAYQIREFEQEGIGNMTAVNIPPSVVALSLPRWGADLGRIMDQYDNMLIGGILVEDTTTGRLRMAPGGRPLAFYEVAEHDFHVLVRGIRLFCELLFEMGARVIYLPFAGATEVRSPDDLTRLEPGSVPRHAAELVTVHVMGTARMGADRTRAVCDGYGRVHDADRLVVCDASLFPTPVGTNPAETIQALATRIAHEILEDPRSHTS
jgi:choline dehydrogenase-like flavoprotein